MEDTLAARFDHASTLPRKPSISDPELARVYFIEGGGLIKIGVTTNLPSRFRTIRNSSPVPVKLLGSIKGGNITEALAHQRFDRLRQHGEWFMDDPELRAYLDDVLQP